MFGEELKKVVNYNISILKRLICSFLLRNVVEGRLVCSFPLRIHLFASSFVFSSKRQLSSSTQTSQEGNP